MRVQRSVCRDVEVFELYYDTRELLTDIFATHRHTRTRTHTESLCSVQATKEQNKQNPAPRATTRQLQRLAGEELTAKAKVRVTAVPQSWAAVNVPHNQHPCMCSPHNQIEKEILGSLTLFFTVVFYILLALNTCIINLHAFALSCSLIL